jgi:3D (Asp-Asp-Asp) domain-containing protein
MTLLLASAGFVTQYPTATRWFFPEQTERLSHQNLSPRARQPSTRAQGIPWIFIVAAMTIALAAAWLSFLSIGDRARGPLLPENSVDHSDSSEIQVTLETPQSLALAENDPASTPFARPDSKTDAKAMLGDDPVAPRDFIGTPSLRLDQEIGLALPTSSFDKISGPNGQKKQVTKAVSRLARVTVYWPEEGDFYTKNRKSSTGVRLRDGHCAVDPEVIPYGSVVHIPSIGPLLAVDTGSAVISRRAAKNAARTPEQRKAIVIDVFCSSRAKAKALIKRIEHFAVVTWQPPQRSAGL